MQFSHMFYSLKKLSLHFHCVHMGKDEQMYISLDFLAMDAFNLVAFGYTILQYFGTIHYKLCLDEIK